MRLVSTYPGLNFLGRVEVYHNNQWGTICDDFFGLTDADVVCQTLNFTNGALCYSSYSFGRGTGIKFNNELYCIYVIQRLIYSYSTDPIMYNV